MDVVVVRGRWGRRGGVKRGRTRCCSVAKMPEPIIATPMAILSVEILLYCTAVY